ncbi:SMI1/KNR4 family protein [Actinokineospora globicatena]|uniref:SMI1/KNR4 family protein n=1 Tax=Actinokineospora globicatena TaxID=103729 RepID=UPI0020A39476|nr:SMI1/KNR4 family protein [Actinokineospora globicatena]MCP2303292.1 Cell wall assembly regulator SMI1 [Actinokineospora globicatena]GLW79578.1 hypothetical protein Aglo01_40590 [Actinokineospora globicatena]
MVSEFVPGRGSRPSAVVWDRDYRYPNHPLPGVPRPAAADPTGQPTDPGVLRRVSELVDEFTAQYERIKGRPPAFGTTVTEADLAAAEARLGARLPEDIRALYLLVGDDPDEIGLLGRWSLMSLDRVVDLYGFDGPGVGGYEDGLFDLDRVVLESEPAGYVRRLSRDDWWIIVGTDGGGWNLVVDLDPGPLGRSGQLLKTGRGIDNTVDYVAESATSVLAAVVAAARADRFDPILIENLDEDPDDDEYEDIGVLIDEFHTSYPQSFAMVGRALAEVVAEFPDPLLVQALSLHTATALDLTALAGTPRLRRLFVNATGHVRASVPPLLESLTITAGSVDWAALAGHPTLWELTVTGAPVRAADLAALPALTRLDLSATEVDDVAALADLDLRVLILNPAQWDKLARLPARLVCAGFVGDGAEDWAARIREIHPG